ncbi:CHAP domain-containing protein [Sorangium sp. So ce1667]
MTNSNGRTITNRTRSPQSRFPASGLAALVLTISTAVLAGDTGGYPYAGRSPSEVDPWRFYMRECTSFAAWKMNQLGVDFSNYMVGPNGVAGHFGNASHWAENARTIGYTVDHTPAVNAIAHWNSGHVAVVDAVNPDGTIVVEEYNWAHPHAYGTRTISAGAPSDYLHVADGAAGDGSWICDR